MKNYRDYTVSVIWRGIIKVNKSIRIENIEVQGIKEELEIGRKKELSETELFHSLAQECVKDKFIRMTSEGKSCWIDIKREWGR